MHIVSIILIITAAIAPQAVFAQVRGSDAAMPSEIDVQTNGDNGYRLILKSYRSSTVPAGQAELIAKSAALCAPRKASFGRYAFDLTEPVAGRKDKATVLVLRQDIECGVAPSAASSPAAQTSTAPKMATPEQVRRVEQQTQRYFEAKDHRHYPSAYDMMAASMKQGIHFETWTGRAEAFNAKAGAVERRTISRITWYHNPPHVEPGLYAAVDFTSKFAGVDLHCGFLAWREQHDGKLVLVREEENYIENEIRQKLAPSDIEKLRQQFNCK